MTNKKKRKVCFVITSGIHYSRSKLILSELKKRADIELQIVVGASAILTNYSDVLSFMEKDGFVCDAKVTMSLEGGSLIAMSKTAGLGILEFSNVFERLKPDIVVIRGDRFEILSVAIAASYQNIAVAHIEGGDVSGNIDELVRHAVTKLSHIHFTTNEDSKNRVLDMGENPSYVFNVGGSEIEFVSINGFKVSNDYINQLGVGDVVDTTKPYLLVMQHPVTSEVGENRKHTEETLNAIKELGIPTIWFWPNADAGTDEVSKAIRIFREEHQPNHIRFIKYLPPEEFIGLLKSTACLIGNSSAGIKECSYLGTPVVNIGSRQQHRLRGQNVIDVQHDKKVIKRAILRQLDHGVYKRSDIYYKKSTSKKIAAVLAKTKIYAQKTFYNKKDKK